MLRTLSDKPSRVPVFIDHIQSIVEEFEKLHEFKLDNKENLELLVRQGPLAKETANCLIYFQKARIESSRLKSMMAHVKELDKVFNHLKEKSLDTIDNINFLMIPANIQLLTTHPYIINSCIDSLLELREHKLDSPELYVLLSSSEHPTALMNGMLLLKKQDYPFSEYLPLMIQYIQDAEYGQPDELINAWEKLKNNEMLTPENYRFVAQRSKSPASSLAKAILLLRKVNLDNPANRERLISAENITEGLYYLDQAITEERRLIVSPAITEEKQPIASSPILEAKSIPSSTRVRIRRVKVSYGSAHDLHPKKIPDTEIKSSEILNQANFDFLIEHWTSENVQYLTSVLINLTKARLNTPDNLNSLKRNIHYIREIRNAFSYNSFNQEEWLLLMNHAAHASEITSVIRALRGNTLSNPDGLNFCLQRIDQAGKLAYALSALTEAKLDTPENRALLIANAEYAGGIERAITHFIERGTLDQARLTILFKHAPYADLICSSFNTLLKENLDEKISEASYPPTATTPRSNEDLFNARNCDYLISQTLYLDKLIRGINFLAQHTLATEDRFIFLIELAPYAPEIASLLSCLNKVGLDNTTTRDILREHARNAEHLSKAYYLLYLHGYESRDIYNLLLHPKHLMNIKFIADGLKSCKRTPRWTTEDFLSLAHYSSLEEITTAPVYPKKITCFYAIGESSSSSSSLTPHPGIIGEAITSLKQYDLCNSENLARLFDPSRIRYFNSIMEGLKEFHQKNIPINQELFNLLTDHASVAEELAKGLSMWHTAKLDHEVSYRDYLILHAAYASQLAEGFIVLQKSKLNTPDKVTLLRKLAPHADQVAHAFRLLKEAGLETPENEAFILEDSSKASFLARGLIAMNRAGIDLEKRSLLIHPGIEEKAPAMKAASVRLFHVGATTSSSSLSSDFIIRMK